MIYDLTTDTTFELIIEIENKNEKVHQKNRSEK